MQVQFLIDQKICNSDKMLMSWIVLPPCAEHDRHWHLNCDEFWIVIKGSGMMYSDEGKEIPSSEGDVAFTPRGHWHGFVSPGESVDYRLEPIGALSVQFGES